MTQDFYQQGLAKGQSGDRYGAVQAFSVAIQSNPQPITELAEPYYQRGLVLFDLGDRQGAIADYNQQQTSAIAGDLPTSGEFLKP
jgi:tetratricopeptide (TPR) repeat protein